MSISLALSTCVLFISLMQLVNGAQFLNAINCYLLLIINCTINCYRSLKKNICITVIT